MIRRKYIYMKKLSLKPNAFDKGEVLTRTQLRKIMGGSGSHGEKCETHADCPSGHVCVQTSLDAICCDSNDLHGSGPHPLPACRNV